MTLKAQILKRIAADGPISIADYMNECLLHPTYGYYATRDPFGADGDFITAPEISQMFGELIGLSLAQSWIDQGSPSHPVLVELGPGRGTLMNDVLRATQRVAGFAPQVHMIEASPKLRAVQQDKLSNFDNLHWHDTLADVPDDSPLLLIANEFFDALPIRQFIRDGDGWCEICIGAKDEALVRGQSGRSSPPDLAHRLEDTSDGDIVELCPALPALTTRIGQQIADHGGAALIIDYGDWRALGDTWQALEQHAPADPLEHPGQADLTAHVDFEALANAAAPAKFSRVTPQGVFLERLGISTRAEQLAAKLSGARLNAHIAAHRRLTHPEEMGNLFKVIGLYPPGATPPPGLDA
jgi:SAM-dependent MidA family methyltransferase